MRKVLISFLVFLLFPVIVSATTLTFAWDAAKYNDGTVCSQCSYILERSSDLGNTWTEIVTTEHGILTATYNELGLITQYRCKAKLDTETSSPSNVVTWWQFDGNLKISGSQ
jgi:hypothetical protein